LKGRTLSFDRKFPPQTRDEQIVFDNSFLKVLLAGRRIVSTTGSDHAITSQGEETASCQALFSYRELQDIADYRLAIQNWYARIEPGDYLAILVPHAFLYNRQLSLPSPLRPSQRRLYSPSSLLGEVEEALAPNSYRIRWLGDVDDGYDYTLPLGAEPRGASDIALVLERMVPPSWRLSATPASTLMPNSAPERVNFEPARTRVEQDGRVPVRRILILKLDHLGDLIMGIPALELARRHFADAEIDLVVGAWNEGMARGLGVADRVVAFDAFPRNSSEEEPDVHATVGLFRQAIPDQYDLAIDLRTDYDTRSLLRAARASIKAGIGTRARFPFLDIALPLDATRNEVERARDDRIGIQDFLVQGSGRRTPFCLHSDKETVDRGSAIFWGPYLQLDPGDYIFEFHLDLETEQGEGLLRFDIALDWGNQVAELFVSGPGEYRLPFRVEKPVSVFEVRAFTVDGHPSISFSFYGGRLVKRGPGNVLHQSEYAALLIELVNMRVQKGGTLQEVASG
jgi:hypothetical protein